MNNEIFNGLILQIAFLSTYDILHNEWRNFDPWSCDRILNSKTIWAR